jgi:hypothetical protein
LIFFSFCLVKDPDNLSFPSFNTSIKYQVDVERNSNKNGFTEEISESYDGLLNIAVSTTYIAGKKVSTYLYPDSDELLFVSGKYFYFFLLNSF